MSKIVCDVCGAAYPETSTRCPVCGSVRYNTPETEAETTVTPRVEREERPAPSRRPSTQNKRRSPKKNGPNIKLIAIIAAVLVLAVVLIILLLSAPSTPSADPTEPPTTPPTEAPTNPDVPCTDITLSETTIVLDAVGATAQLSAVCGPENTTDRLVFTSSDPAVATVDEIGEVVAVGPGTAIITVICGDITATCEVQCTMEIETEPPTNPDAGISLRKYDVTLFRAGEKWSAYNGTAVVSSVTFTSANEAVATFVDGVVTAVGPGTTKVFAEYEGQKIECIIRCSFSSSGGNGGVEEDNGNVNSGKYTLKTQHGINKAHDITIDVGETLNFKIIDTNDQEVTFEWTVNKEGIIAINGASVSGVASGSVEISALCDGETVTCIIRVR